MKKIQRWLVVLGIGLMTLMMGCANKPIMPPLKYNKLIDFKVEKNAYLNWEVGKQYSGAMPATYYHNNGGVIGALVMSAMDSVDRTNNPSRYTFSYGKAEQTVFMTSLRDILLENQVFKHVELIADSNQVVTKDVLVNIFFKTARVSSPERGSKITLSVEMTITNSGKAPFKRTYLVQGNAEGFVDSFREEQIDVSNRLLEKVISGIKEWHKITSVGSKK